VYRAFSGTSKPNMPPIFDKPTTEKYDYVVIGGGSGGSGTSVSKLLLFAFAEGFIYLDLCFIILIDKRRAASYGKKVAVVEVDPYLGGTCVNVGL
jgi:glutathione reductase (NADPH)